MYNHYTVSSICTVFLLVNGDALSMNANRFSENERCVAWQLQKFVNVMNRKPWLEKILDSGYSSLISPVLIRTRVLFTIPQDIDFYSISQHVYFYVNQNFYRSPAQAGVWTVLNVRCMRMLVYWYDKWHLLDYFL